MITSILSTTYPVESDSRTASAQILCDAEKAKIEHDKLVAEKVKKGYQLVGSISAPPRVVVPQGGPAAPAPKIEPVKTEPRGATLQ